ncbi:hypothetical protein C8R44DRAFT_746166 [Mycena epipterygia]|nr:hypothetical protein C8R44DRAFT_746166 [Mycena epipterygia]
MFNLMVYGLSAQAPAFVWGASHRKAALLLLGEGNVFLARAHNPEVDQHRSLRAIMNPAFSAKKVFILEHPFNTLGGHSKLTRIHRTMIDSASSLKKFGLLVDAALRYIPDTAFRGPVGTVGLPESTSVYIGLP